jgi:mono/diheme cytochrome c family protein
MFPAMPLACFLFRCVVFAVCVAAPMWSVADDDPFAAWRKEYETAIYPILDQACSECHRGADAEGFDLEQFGASEKLQKNATVWEEVAKRVRLNEMPPEGSPQLNDEQKALVHRWFDSRPDDNECERLANEETQAWYRGVVMSRRLTRTEYLNAIRDLVGMPVDESLQVPSDGSGGEGFDTAGDALFTSALHIEQYLAVSNQVITDALNSGGQSSLAGGLLTDITSEADAREAINQFARRAWRRPVDGSEVDRLMTLMNASQQSGMPIREATADAFKAILVSPNFLFVVETESEAGGVQPLTPHQMATRLALFLWSSIPDETLMLAADANELATDEQIISQMHRMLADDRSRALGENFGLQWLGLSQFEGESKPDTTLFPDFDERLAADMREEAVRTVWNVFKDDRPLMELIDADSIHANSTLASYYGLDASEQGLTQTDDLETWKRIPLSDRRRGGVITLAAVLTRSSYGHRTSPVLRGRWVLEEVLGGRVPPPPPGVPALEEAEADHAATLREQLEIHRKDPQCAACHNRMDPIGFGLENFDAIGRWRTEQDGQSIDSSGKLPSGETFSGPEELKQLLLGRSGEFKKHFVKKLYGFALGRSLNKFDKCVVDESLEALDANDQRATVILETIVTSYPFRNRYFKPANP